MIAMYSPSHKWHYVNEFKERFAKGFVQGSERLDGLLSWKERCKEKNLCVIVLDAIPNGERSKILEGFRDAPFNLRVIWTEGTAVPLPDGITHITQQTTPWKELSAKGENPHIAFLRKNYQEPDTPSPLVGSSKVMQNLRQAIQEAGRDLSTISPLLVGETGTGKNLVAGMINDASGNKGMQMLSVNCSHLSDDVGKVLLFGSVPGAFTGAVARKGILGETNGKTLFLDEMQTMSASTQQNLLDVIESHTFRKLGETRVSVTHFSLISAMNEDPFLLMERGILREDLFHRICGNLIFLPPLRAHKEDIPLLVKAKIGEDKPIAPSFLERLEEYDWPGNVRELEMCVHKAECYSKGKEQLDFPAGPIDPRKECPWPMHRLSTGCKAS